MAAPTIHRKLSLQELREREGRLQAELAERLDVKHSTVSRYETSVDPKLSTLDSFISALGGELLLVAGFKRPDGRVERFFLRTPDDPRREVDTSHRWRGAASSRPAREARAQRLAALVEGEA